MWGLAVAKARLMLEGELRQDVQNPLTAGKGKMFPSAVPLREAGRTQKCTLRLAGSVGRPSPGGDIFRESLPNVPGGNDAASGLHNWVCSAM
jgi:hypothetical protein